ncbi:hypothetical protein EIP86_000964 [Pleurotus ostreatoroseus]|nr:hypothetical protein EIP86_000964 [Pleurotus ostreatoroseus]
MREGKRSCRCQGRCACQNERDVSPTHPPTPTPTEVVSIDALIDEFGFLHFDFPPVAACDVLGPNEIAEDDPAPMPPLNEAEEWYLVSVGRFIGCFLTWEQAGALVNRFPANLHRKYSIWNEMWAVWVNNCINGIVRGPLHPDSVVPFVVSRAEIARRIAAETARRRDAAEAAHRAATLSSESQAEPTATPTIPAAPTASSSCAAPVCRSDNSPAHPGALPPYSASIPSSSSSVTSVTLSSVSGTVSGPTDSKGKSVAGLLTDERRALMHVHSNNLPPPAAWVIVRGVAPGVYTSRAEYLANRGNHPRVWVLTCPSEERAEAMFAYLMDFMEFLPPQ